MKGLIFGVVLTTVSYVIISKLIKQKESSIQKYIDCSAEKLRDYIDNFLEEKNSHSSQGAESENGKGSL
ncbi:hypothetical protein [Silvanigrella aquatica]|uniref:Uncharacterized protein n=1 Tax=Silvanigrella aquatica TaxID=1915309 RepID=A0A1L4D3N4_9BACT|nr:hypothetical protein [Silvanigrella aquatica]APJ04782.1 hypothetical protein AXG55_13095 [Silvanigrella aquatica]